jgi:4-amino-4-deoxy-L-arabinose transferase-like glycosyltransferase
VAWAVWAARPPSADLHDPNFYLLYGEQLARGNGYRLPSGDPTAYYPPGYPLALAPFFWLLYRTPLPDTGEVATVAVLNVAWQLGTIVVVFLLARRLTGRAVAGLVAAGVLALWPNLVFHTAVALTESLFLLLLALVLLVVAGAPWAERRWEPWRLGAVGGLLGAATLVRPVTVPLLVVLPVVLLAARFGWRRAVGHTALVGACVVAVLLPWIVRNAVVMDAVTLSTNTGDNLCMSRRVGGSGGFEFPNERCFPPRFEQIPRPQTEVLRDRHGRDEAISFVQEHPDEELRLIWRRLLRTFESDADGIEAVESYGSDPWLGDGTRTLLRRLASGYGLVVGLLAVPGLWLLARRSPAGLLVAAGGASMLLAPLAFFGDPRFHVPLVPVAAVAVGVLVTARGAGGTGARAGAGAPVRSRDP